MTDQTPFGTFFLPGPTEVRAEVLAAMCQPMIPHRGASYEALQGRVVQGLQHVFRTARPVYVMTASATGAMEAAIRGAPSGPVLALVNGSFSDRFAKIAQSCGRETEVLEVPAGEAPDHDRVTTVLRARAFAAVTVVHSETSTGVLTDIRAITELAHAHGAVCLIDSVTGIGGTPVETDGWGLDFVLTGSQKALALPPGLAFAVASERFIEQARRAPDRGRYLDIVEYEEFARKSQTPNTPALSLIYAADAQLTTIVRDGIEARWARHAAMAAETARWVDEVGAAVAGLRMLPRAGQRSHTVSAIALPSGMRSADVVKRVAARGFVIGAGYGATKETTIRIGHMGDHTLETLRPCLAAVRAALLASD